MKTNVAFIVAILISLCQQTLSAQQGYTQAFDPNWVKTFAASGFSWAYDMAVDKQGNIYATGYYQSTLNIDTFAERKSTLHLSAGSGDTYFLCKFDPKGKFCWIQRGFGQTRPCKVKLDLSGNIQVVGTCHGNELLLTTGASDTITFKNQVNYRAKIFLARYSPEGEILQARLLPSNRRQTANDFDFDEQGNLYVGGSYEFREKNNPSLVQQSYLILKLNSDFKTLWQLQGDTTGKSHIFAIDYDPKFGLLVGGGYERWLRIADDSVCTPNNEGYRFFAKFDTDFRYQRMVTNIGRTPQGNCIGAKFDHQGNIVIVCNSSYGFLTLAKYSSSVEPMWLLDSKGQYSAYPEKLIIDQSDNIYICGNSYGVTFSSTYGLEAQAERAGYAPFIVKYRPNGKLWWLKTIGGGGTRYCKSMAIYGDKIYGFGWTNDELKFATKAVPATSGYMFWIGEFDLAAFNQYEIWEKDRR